MLMSDEAHRQNLQLIEEVGQLLTTLQLPEVLRHIVDITSRITHASRISLLFEDTGRWVYYTHGHNLSDKEEAYAAQEVIKRGFSGWVMRERRGDIIYDIDTDDRWYKFPDYFHEVRSAVGVPLIYRDKVLGALVASHPHVGYYADTHLHLLHTLSLQASVAIYNAQTFALLESQKRQLHAVLQAVPDVLLVLDSSGYVRMASDAILQLLDGLTVERIVGMKMDALAQIDDVFGAVLPTVSGQMPEYGEWSFEARSNKRKRDYLITVSVWYTPNRAETGYVIVMKDITTMRNLARVKDDVMSLVRHDLAQPLYLIKGYNSLLADDLGMNGDPLGLLTYARQIDDATVRMERLLEKLMMVEKARSSTLEMVERVALNTLAQNAYHDQAPFAQNKHITLINQIATTEEAEIVGDALMLQQSMENLIGNAIKYTPMQGTVTVETRTEDSWFTFTVTDSGIGIAAEELDYVFESFYRAKNADGMAKGSGIGLNLVRTIIEKHGGHVGVSSTLGKGSRFWFKLPVVLQ